MMSNASTRDDSAEGPSRLGLGILAVANFAIFSGLVFILIQGHID